MGQWLARWDGRGHRTRSTNLVLKSSKEHIADARLNYVHMTSIWSANFSHQIAIRAFSKDKTEAGQSISSPAMDYTTLVLLCLLWFICFLAMKYRKPEIPLPPGPKPWPLIGNVLHMPTIRPWERYRKWCETYSRFSVNLPPENVTRRPSDSDIVYLRLPLKPAVVVGSAQAAMDLFEKRSHIYSDRNTSVMTQLYA